MKRCCICGEPIDGFGNNPWPLVEDEDAECCDECNGKVVLARIKLMMQEYNNGSK